MRCRSVGTFGYWVKLSMREFHLKIVRLFLTSASIDQLQVHCTVCSDSIVLQGITYQLVHTNDDTYTTSTNDGTSSSLFDVLRFLQWAQLEILRKEVFDYYSFDVLRYSVDWIYKASLQSVLIRLLVILDLMSYEGVRIAFNEFGWRL